MRRIELNIESCLQCPHRHWRGDVEEDECRGDSKDTFLLFYDSRGILGDEGYTDIKVADRCPLPEIEPTQDHQEVTLPPSSYPHS